MLRVRGQVRRDRKARSDWFLPGIFDHKEIIANALMSKILFHHQSITL